jgi:hypothetical protein
MDVLRAASFLIGDGRLCKEGVRLGTKSSDWPIHVSVHEVASMLEYKDLPLETKPYLQFPFVATKDFRGRARAWESCNSGIGKTTLLSLDLLFERWLHSEPILVNTILLAFFLCYAVDLV